MIDTIPLICDIRLKGRQAMKYQPGFICATELTQGVIWPPILLFLRYLLSDLIINVANQGSIILYRFFK